MKRISVLSLYGLILAALPAMSQTQHGSWELSTAVNLGSTTSSYSRGWNFHNVLFGFSVFLPDAK